MIMRFAFLLVLCLGLMPLQSRASGHDKEEKAEIDESLKPKGPQYVEIGPISVPVMINGKITQYVLVVAVLETPDFDKSEEVKKYIPLLKDAYLSRLYGSFAVGDGMAQGVVNIDRLRQRLEAANAKVLPDGLVTQTLLQTVNQRNS